MQRVAVVLSRITKNRLSPNAVTIFGLLMHIPIAWLIAMRHPLWAALFLAIFGLFDTLDGELARSQNKTSALGMFLDSATDRIKEIMLYCGMAIFLIDSGASKTTIVILIVALGISILTSYLNAWGEAVLANFSHHKLDSRKIALGESSKDHKVNKTFRSGLLGFDTRIVLIIIGLVSGKLPTILYIIVVFGSITVLQRFMHITKKLKNVQD